MELLHEEQKWFSASYTAAYICIFPRLLYIYVGVAYTNMVQKIWKIFFPGGILWLHYEGFGLDWTCIYLFSFVKKPWSINQSQSSLFARWSMQNVLNLRNTSSALSGYLSGLDCELQPGSGVSSESLCIIRVLSFVCCVFKLVTVDTECDIWPLCHFTPAWLKEPMPPVTTSVLNVKSFFCSRAPPALLKAHLSLSCSDGIYHYFISLE